MARVVVMHWIRRRDGSAAVEFALLVPLLLAVLFGIVSYGGYFWTAHAVQQLANDAARAALAGADAAERQSLAQSSIDDSVGDYANLDAAKVHTVVAAEESRIVVRLSYDAAASPFYAFSGLAPMPPPLITRTASVRLGGY